MGITMKTIDRIRIALLLCGLMGLSHASYAASSVVTFNTTVKREGGGRSCESVSPATTTCKQNCKNTIEAIP